MKKAFKHLSIIFAVSLIILPGPHAKAECLKQAVRRTVYSNPTILFNAQNVPAMNEAVKGAKGRYLPSVDIYANYGRERSANSSTGFDYLTLTHREAGVELRENLFNGFGDISEVGRNKARLASAKYKTEGVSEDVGLHAVKAYIDVLRTQSIVAYAAANYHKHQQIYKMIEQRTSSGLSRKADLDQARGRLALSQANLLSTRNDYQNAKIIYQQITGVMPSKLSYPPIPKDSALPRSENKAVSQALYLHPTLKSAKSDTQAACEQHRAARSLLFPKLDVVLGANNRHDIDGIRGKNNDRYALLELRYNLFRGGTDYAKQKETAYYVEQANEVKNLTYRQVTESMRLSWDALKTAKQQLWLFGQHRDLAIKTSKAYKEQYQIGKRTLLDLLNSENEVFSAERNYVNGRYNVIYSKYRVLNSEGQLLPYLGIAPPMKGQERCDGLKGLCK